MPSSTLDACIIPAPLHLKFSAKQTRLLAAGCGRMSLPGSLLRRILFSSPAGTIQPRVGKYERFTHSPAKTRRPRRIHDLVRLPQSLILWLSELNAINCIYLYIQLIRVHHDSAKVQIYRRMVQKSNEATSRYHSKPGSRRFATTQCRCSSALPIDCEIAADSVQTTAKMSD